MKNQISLKWKILKYLTFYTIILFAFLFLFQVVLLDKFYENVKKAQLIHFSNEVKSDYENGQIDTIIEKSITEEMCVVIINNEEIQSFSRCLEGRLSMDTLVDYQQNHLNHQSSLLLENNFNFDNKGPRDFRSLAYLQMVEDSLIVVVANITPINATISTLTYQLFFIAGILFISVVILTVILNNRFVKPLEKINAHAKQISKGQYERVQAISNKEMAELNETLLIASSDILKADKAKQDLIGNISHDLRTPLTMISGYGEMMLDFDEEKTNENIQIIIDEAKRLNDLVDDLLDLSKLQENAISLQMTTFDLTKLIEDILKRYHYFIQNEQFEIIFNYQKHAFIHADMLRLSQVLHNFISNAINYHGQEKKVIISQTTNDKQVTIEVTDFGKGIAKMDLPFIWDRYYKIDKHEKRFETGSGVGLSIAREILELHHVDYGVRSVEGKGSTFYFTFDKVKEQEENLH